MDQNNYNGSPYKLPDQIQQQVPVQPSPSPLPVSPQYVAELPKKSKTKIIVAIVIILVILGAGAGALAYGLRSVSPKIKIVKAIISYANVRSFAYNAALEGSLTPPAEQDLSLGTFSYIFNSQGKVDLAKKDSPVMDMSFSASLSANDTKGNTDISTNFNFIATDQKGYLKFNTIKILYVPKTTDILMSQVAIYFQSILNNFTNKWIAVDIKPSVNAKKYEEKLDDKELGKRVASFDYITKIEKLKDEEVNGVDTEHYRLLVSNTELKKIYESAQKNGKTSFVPAQALAAVAQTLNGKGETTQIDIWIGKKDNYFYKFSFSELTFEDSSSEVALSTKGTVTFKDYNKPVTVTKPKESISVEELMQSFMPTQTPSKVAPTATTKKR